MKEFQALGLDVSIINDNGETLQLKEIEEAEDKDDFATNIDEIDSPAKEIVSESEGNSEEVEEEYEDELEEDEDFIDEEPTDEEIMAEEGADI